MWTETRTNAGPDAEWVKAFPPSGWRLPAAPSGRPGSPIAVAVGGSRRGAARSPPAGSPPMAGERALAEHTPPDSAAGRLGPLPAGSLGSAPPPAIFRCKAFLGAACG